MGACGDACTAEAAAAEYRIGGRTVGTALGAGTAGTGSFAAVGDAAGTEPLAAREGGASPVGLCAVPSSVGFRAAALVPLPFAAVGLCALSSASSLSLLDIDGLVSFFAGVRVCVCTGTCPPMSEVSAREVESCDD